LFGPHGQYRQHIGQAREQRPLDRETRERLLVCGAVIAHAGLLQDPLAQLTVRVG
jgi:hypothetical protein